MAIASRTSSHYHHILHCIIPHRTPSLTFQATPHSKSHHHQFSPYRTFHITPTPLAAHYSTLQYHIGFESHHIGHIMHRTTSSRAAPYFYIPDGPHNATFHVLYATFQITPYIGHIIYSHHILHKTLHCISHTPHLASFNHKSVTVVTSHSSPIPLLTMFRITFHIAHQWHHHFLHPTAWLDTRAGLVSLAGTNTGIIFVATNMLVSCRDKIISVATNAFVARNDVATKQCKYFCRRQT